MSKFRVEGDSLIEVDLIIPARNQIGLKVYARRGYGHMAIWPHDMNTESQVHRVILRATTALSDENKDVTLWVAAEDLAAILTWFSGTPCPPIEILAIGDQAARNIAWDAWKNEHGH